MRQLQFAACSGKVKFQTPQIAWRNLAKLTKRHNDRVFYRCTFCGQFHIGSRTEKARKRDESQRSPAGQSQHRQ
jgi:hypothetical protein